MSLIKQIVKGAVARNLLFLIVISFTPAMVIILYSGHEQVDLAVKNTQNEVMEVSSRLSQAYLHQMESTSSLLTTMSLIPSVRKGDIHAIETLLSDIQKNNIRHENFTFTDYHGHVLVSSMSMDSRNLGDRPHIKRALKERRFIIGDFIIPRIKNSDPAMPFVHPVFSYTGILRGLVTTAVRVGGFDRYINIDTLPDRSFIAITDRKGIRLYFQPVRNKTNPVGKKIKEDVWNRVKGKRNAGVFREKGSDGVMRIMAFRPIMLHPGGPVHAYAWAGIPEDYVVQPGITHAARNLIILFILMAGLLLIAWLFARRSVVMPVKSLLELAEQYKEGDLSAEIQASEMPRELELSLQEAAVNLQQSRDSIKSSEMRSKLMMNSIEAVVFVSEIDTGKILFINEYGTQIFGDITGKTCWETIHCFEGAYEFCTESDFSQQEEGHYIVKTIERYNEELKKWFEVRYRAIDWIDGTLVRLEIATDITARKRSEAEQVKMMKLKSVGMLAGGLAHDFNNLLSGIIGNIELAKIRGNISDASDHYLDEAVKAVTRARKLANQFLTFSKGGDPVKKVVSLEDVIREAVEPVTHLETISTIYTIPPDLAPVEVDPAQISQVIQNLVLNACEAMVNDGSVEIRCANITGKDTLMENVPPEKPFVKLDVIDEGEGISEEVINNVFDPYFTTKELGSGLGLAISFSIISKHGGAITVSSEPHKGAIFTIYLPASSASPRERVIETEISNSGEKDQSMVLVMDDEEMIRKLMVEMLTELGYQVVTACHGEEAVALYLDYQKKSRSFAVTILDLSIPGGMGGKEAAKEILSLDPHAKLIVASGYSQDPVMARSGEFGFAYALEKPFQFQQLQEAVEEVLAS